MHVEPTPIMTECPLCAGETRTEFRELRYDFGDVTVVVQDVPVTTCEGCDEVFVAGELGIALGDIVEQVAEAARLAAQSQHASTTPLETILRLPRTTQTPLLASA